MTTGSQSDREGLGDNVRRMQARATSQMMQVVGVESMAGLRSGLF